MPSLELKEIDVPLLRCHASKRVELFYDTLMKGLAVQVTRAGVATYVVQHRKQTGGKLQSAIGGTDVVTLEEARAETVRRLDKYKKADTERTKALGKETLSSVFTDYIRAKNIIPENARRYEQALKTYGGPLWETGLREITHKLVLDQREKVADGSFIKWHEKHTTPVPRAKGGPGCANDLVEYGSMVCTHTGMGQEKNPFRGIEPYPVGDPREKVVLEPSAWPRLAKALERRAFDERILFWTTCLMGARPLAAVRMRWDRLDLERGTYHLTKNKIECAGWKPAESPAWDYPLDFWLREMLIEQRDWARSKVYLFPSNQQKRADSPLGEGALNRLFASLVAEGALPPGATPYALRYTRATYSELLFGSVLMVQRMLNHQSDWGLGQTVQGARLASTPGYIKTVTEKVRVLVDKYASTIRQLCGYDTMSEETRRVFIEGEMPTIYQRHEYAMATGEHIFQATN